MTIKQFKNNLDKLLEISGSAEEEELYFRISNGQTIIYPSNIVLTLDIDNDIRVDIKIDE
jgi:hypothetical protein